jgi:hypothetical protein
MRSLSQKSNGLGALFKSTRQQFLLAWARHERWCLLPLANVLWFARAGSRLSSGFLLPGISLGYTRTHVCVCELVLVHAHTACLQRRARATRRPARRWYRHGAAGWAALGGGRWLGLDHLLEKCALAHLAAQSKPSYHVFWVIHLTSIDTIITNIWLCKKNS